jgi:RNA polymerase sigma-70 factor, ECF subfamily
VEATDNDLMTHVRDGDLGKLGTLFERHHARLFNFFLRLTGSRALSEDLVQEVFVRILKYRQSFRSPGEFVPWMFRLARNVSNDHFERRRPEVSDDEVLAAQAAAAPLPPEELEQAESSHRLRSALLRLPVEKREVLVLSRFGDLRYEEIARLLGCSVGAVKLRVHRALKDLRGIYDGMAQEAMS